MVAEKSQNIENKSKPDEAIEAKSGQNTPNNSEEAGKDKNKDETVVVSERRPLAGSPHLSVQSTLRSSSRKPKVTHIW